MKISDVIQSAKSGQLKEIQLVSLEGGSYSVHVDTGDAHHAVRDASGNVLHVASIDEARKHFASIADVPTFLVQPAIQDEMVGQPVAEKDSREPVSLRANM